MWSDTFDKFLSLVLEFGHRMGFLGNLYPTKAMKTSNKVETNLTWKIQKMFKHLQVSRADCRGHDRMSGPQLQ